MGEAKMLLPLAGTTLFEHVLANHLGSSLRRVCAVVPGWLDGFMDVLERRKGDRVGFAVLSRECEMSQSLKAGWRFVMEAWRPDAVMISLADKPLVTSGLIDSVIEGFVRSGSAICVPAFHGRRGHPVILKSGLEAEVYGLKGDCGARTIVEAHLDGVCEVPVDSDGILVDVDTYDDFNGLKRRLGID
jgi:molybdenum cofactor cytidylyltransferase